MVQWKVITLAAVGTGTCALYLASFIQKYRRARITGTLNREPHPFSDSTYAIGCLLDPQVLEGTTQLPVVDGWLPFVGCGLAFVRNPRQFLLDTRKQIGDTFILQMFGARMLFVFSARGVRSLYQLPEADASFTEATRSLLSLKIPEEVDVSTLT